MVIGGNSQLTDPPRLQHTRIPRRQFRVRGFQQLYTAQTGLFLGLPLASLGRSLVVFNMTAWNHPLAQARLLNHRDPPGALDLSEDDTDAVKCLITSIPFDLLQRYARR
jgi:hypothetical protein